MAKTDFDLRESQTFDQLAMQTPTELQDLLMYCQQHNVLTICGLSEAPASIKILIQNEKFVPYILKLLLQRKTMAAVCLATKIQVYADSEEQQAMEICHPRCIELLQNFADKIVHHGRIRALDVAGGDGRVTKDLILTSYDRGDLID